MRSPVRDAEIEIESRRLELGGDSICPRAPRTQRIGQIVELREAEAPRRCQWAVQLQVCGVSGRRLLGRSRLDMQHLVM